MKKAIDKFFLTPASPRPIGALRIGLAAALLFQAYLVSGELFNLYGRAGILQGVLGEVMNEGRLLPGVTQLTSWLGSWGIDEHRAIAAVALSYIGSLVLLLVGFHTRVAAVLAWLTHTLLVFEQTTSYGVDCFAQIFLFYMMLMPAGNAFSLDRAAGRVSGEATRGARISLRILQLHLCIAYFFSGFEKALGEQWWNGEAIWRSLMLPQYRQFDFSWLSRMPWLAKVLGWQTLLVEGAYPIFIWPRLTRKAWIVAVVGMHVGIVLFLGLGIFGLVMSILTLCAFGVSSVQEADTRLNVERVSEEQGGAFVPAVAGYSACIRLESSGSKDDSFSNRNFDVLTTSLH